MLGVSLRFLSGRFTIPHDKSLEVSAACREGGAEVDSGDHNEVNADLFADSVGVNEHCTKLTLILHVANKLSQQQFKWLSSS